MANIRARLRSRGRITQGDVFKDIEFVEHISERRGKLEISKVVFPLVVVLTQDCDLKQHFAARAKARTGAADQDKYLFSVLVTPLYNAEHVFLGEHLSMLNRTMGIINKKKTPGDLLKKNERARYHYLDFPDSVRVVPAIADFKHSFTVSIGYLESVRAAKHVCRLSELYREDLTLRFANYLSRIGLPDMDS